MFYDFGVKCKNSHDSHAQSSAYSLETVLSLDLRHLFFTFGPLRLDVICHWQEESIWWKQFGGKLVKREMFNTLSSPSPLECLPKHVRL